jgi:branched-chain amino acid transport system substrate-binding protein
MQEWRDFMKTNMADADQTDVNYAYSYGVTHTLVHVLRQCGDDLSRENIMKQVASINGLEVPTLIPGIRVNTSPTNFHPIRHMQLQKWTGATWERFGGIIEGAAV